MVRFKFLLISAIFTLFTACSSGGRGNEPEDDLSSAQSSAISSSSAVSSSSFDPNGPQPASWNHLPAVVNWGNQGGHAVLYIFGQSGIYSKLFTSESGAIIAHIVGTYTLEQGTMALDYVECLAPINMADTLCGQSSRYVDQLLHWRVRGDTLWGGSNVQNLPPRFGATLRINELLISNGSAITGSWSNTRGDTTEILEIFSGAKYISRLSVNDSIVNNAFGRWDVHGNSIVLINENCLGSCYLAEFFTASIPSQNTLRLNIQGRNTTKTFVAQPQNPVLLEANLRGIWRASPTANMLWKLDLNPDGSMVLEVLSDRAIPQEYYDTGNWQTVGSWLFLNFADGRNCSGQQRVGAQGGTACWSFFMVPALLQGDTLQLQVEEIPSTWTPRQNL